MSTVVRPTHTPELFEAAVRRAVELLSAGEVVALPTETVYGLAANALDAAAVARIYAAKGRPAHNPLIVHVADMAGARRVTRAWPDAAQRLASAFWPGPLTLVLPRAAGVPDIVTAGGDTVGVRWPGHPFIQAVIRACGFPLAAPSANLANRVSPTNAGHVLQNLDGRIPLVVDGGQCQVGIESTVLDLTTEPPRILRPGMIHADSLAAASGQGIAAFTPGQGTATGGEPVRSPGQLPRHYSPRARLRVLRWRDEVDLLGQLRSLGEEPMRCHAIAHSKIPGAAGLGGVSVIPHDAEAFARALYAELHRCDEEGAHCIVVEAPAGGAEWEGIADRLRRAAVAASGPE